jgi:Na+/proline symporter
MGNVVLLGIFVYIVLQLLIGGLVARKVFTERDYLLGGRSLGPVVGTMTIFATWFGAETCIGSAGRAYEFGLAGGRADPFGYALCILLFGLFFAVPFWRSGITTLADLFAKRFGSGIEKIVVFVIAPTSIIWAAAQIRAFAQVLSTASQWNLEVTIVLATVVVLVYTTMGGLLADAYTDLVQGVTLIFGLLILFTVILIQDVNHAVLSTAFAPERLHLVRGDDASIWATLETWSVPILGSLFAQELISRTLSMQSAALARRASLYAVGVYLAVGGIPLFLGMLGPALLPGLEDSEQILPALARQHLPTLLYVLFAGALVSAILSTVDSALLAAGALVSHNVIIPAVKTTRERTKLLISRACVLGCGLVAFGLAHQSESIYALVETASAIGSAGILVCVLFSFVPQLGGKISAGATLLVGTLAYVVGTVMEFPYPYLLSLGMCLVVFCGVAAGERFWSAWAPVAAEPVAVEQTAVPEE